MNAVCRYCSKIFPIKFWGRDKYCTKKCAATHREQRNAARRVATFWSKVKRGPPDECWPWQGPYTGKGYGVTRVFYKIVLCHRYAYELTYGAVSKGLLVCHSCDRRECCNPNHLWIGTHYDNLTDMRAKGRQIPRAKKGESNAKPYIPSPI